MRELGEFQEASCPMPQLAGVFQPGVATTQKQDNLEGVGSTARSIQPSPATGVPGEPAEPGQSIQPNDEVSTTAICLDQASVCFVRVLDEAFGADPGLSVSHVPIDEPASPGGIFDIQIDTEIE